MLTRKETLDTAEALQENYHRLGYSAEKVAEDLQLSIAQVESILRMESSHPDHVWMMRDYLEEMLQSEGKELYPLSRLADHSAN